MLPLLSSAVESSAQMARFEAFAGRSAMIGFGAALFIEALSESSVFAIPSDQLAAVAAAFAVCIGAAAALAARGGAPAGGEGMSPHFAADGAHQLEAVVSSLTASARSASGVTQLKVDEVRGRRQLQFWGAGPQPRESREGARAEEPRHARARTGRGLRPWPRAHCHHATHASRGAGTPM